MGQLIRQIKKKNGLIRRFAEEEDAVGVVEHSFKDRQTE